MIFYFSGTGNTRWAAQRLAEKTGERLLFIPDEMKRSRCHYELQDGERLGFCFPVHGWQPPHIVREFLQHSTFNLQPSARPKDACYQRDARTFNLQRTFTYALVTCGDSIGRTMEMLNKELAPKGLHLDSVFSLVMPESYVCLPFMYTDTPQREHEKITKASSDLDHYIEMIIERKANEVHTQRGLTPWTFSHVIGAYFNARMITDKKFTIDTDQCIHCGKCAQVCPTGNIIMNDGIPSWLHNGSCTNCLACYHYCPRHAINYGSITRKRGQYYFGHKK